MKKYIVIALAALVAFTACTKVNPEEKKSEKISFNVANYVPQTKADTDPRNVSLDSEGYFKFTCNAWYFPAIATETPMQYMNNVIVNYTAATQSAPAVWAPAEDYYWPKTGYINFYSYAGTKDPNSVTAANDNKKAVTITYSGITIADNDNILVADPALHFGLADADSDLVKINDEYKKENNNAIFDYTTGQYTYNALTQEPGFTGVPTLFHHMLAKVAFVVKLKTTATASTSTTWEVEVLTNGSNIAPFNKGTLTLTNTENASQATIGAWTTTGWQKTTDKETITFANKTLTIQPNATESAETDNILLPVRTVMPQATEGVAFNFSYKVTAKHGNTAFMSEVLTVPTTNLKALASTVENWAMNQITLYTITIDPVGKKVTFDPAVVEWDSQAGTISLPVATTTTGN